MWSAVDRRLGPGALIVLQLAALWPLGVWYVRRMGDGSDEPWGIAALIAALGIVFLRRRCLATEPRRGFLIAAGGLTAAAIGAALFVAPLAGAVLGVAALSCTVGAVRGADRLDWPWTALTALALPIVSSLQFYLGYPLRLVAASASAITLSAVGIFVEQNGTALTWAGRSVMVDAPCSGVHMLWAGMFFASVLAALRSMGGARFAALLAWSVLVVVAANALRNTVLFVKEAGIVALPAWAHDGVGVVAFTLAAVVIFQLASGGSHAG